MAENTTLAVQPATLEIMCLAHIFSPKTSLKHNVRQQQNGQIGAWTQGFEGKYFEEISEFDHHPFNSRPIQPIRPVPDFIPATVLSPGHQESSNSPSGAHFCLEECRRRRKS